MNSANDEDRTRDHRLSPVRHVAGHRLQWQHFDIASQRDAPGWTDYVVAADDRPRANDVITIGRAEFVEVDGDGAVQQFGTG